MSHHSTDQEQRATSNGQPGQPADNLVAANTAPEPVSPSRRSSLQPTAADSQLDPFDPAHLRLPQDFTAGLGVKKLLLTVPIRRPAKEWFVQTHPDSAYRIETCVLELKEDRETYLVDPALWPELAGEATFGPRAMFTSISRQGVLFLWPVRLPGPDGKLDTWNASAVDAATMAAGKWVRVSANMSLGAYEVHEATGMLPEPQWPDVPFTEILRTAFKGRFIDSLSHLVLQRLRGER